MELRLSKLKISAFRGLSTAIELDLSSPVTLIFAPNGTGKTTVCEAAEWLLTGQIQRLKEGDAFDLRLLRSAFSGGENPTVSADLNIGNDSVHLLRTVDGAFLGPTPDRLLSISQEDLLARLAPSAIPYQGGEVSPIVLRQHWLRGTRFLMAEALSALIDSDSATIERRTQVFADLLGIRHLLDAERSCEVLAQSLDEQARGISREIGGRDEELRLLKEELDQEASDDHTTHNLLSEAEQLLGLPEGHPGDHAQYEARIRAVAAHQSATMHELQSRRSALRNLAKDWDALPETESRLTEIRQQEASQAEIVEEANRVAQAAFALETKHRAQIERLEGRRQLTHALRDRFRAGLDAVGGAHPLRTLARRSTTTLQALLAQLPEAQWPDSLLREQLSSSKSALETVSQIVDDFEKHEDLINRYRIASEAMPSAAERGRLDQQFYDASFHANTAHIQYEKQTNPLQQLQMSGRELVGQRPYQDHSDCPLCGHDFEDREALHQAMLIRHTGTASQADLEKMMRLARDRLLTARAEKDAADSAADLAQRLSKEVAAATERLGKHRAVLEKLGVSEVDLAELPSRLSNVTARTELALRVANVLKLLRESQSEFSGMTALEVPLQTPLRRLRRLILGTLSRQIASLEEEIATARADLGSASANSSSAREEYALNSAHLQQIRQTATEYSGQLSNLRSQWNVASGGREWSAEPLGLVELELERLSEQLRRAERCLGAAQVSLGVSLRRARMSELEATVVPLVRQRASVLESRDAAHRTAATFHSNYTDISRRQVRDLSNVVNPLFARMHANRVFDRIELGRDENFLRWLADAGTVQLTPGRDFSQGQRQDLALALFLARARSLRGAFFLDEPVTHLDDLNRVGLLDVFRATTMEGGGAMQLIVTTASRTLARHMVEKFHQVGQIDTPEGQVHPLKVLELGGNGRTGIDVSQVYPSRIH